LDIYRMQKRPKFVECGRGGGLAGGPDTDFGLEDIYRMQKRPKFVGLPALVR
jgi:hypothetical protein